MWVSANGVQISFSGSDGEIAFTTADTAQNPRRPRRAVRRRGAQPVPNATANAVSRAALPMLVRRNSGGRVPVCRPPKANRPRGAPAASVKGQ